MLWACGSEVYKMEKSKEDTWDPWKLRSRNFSMTSEEFLWTKIIYITIAKCSFTEFDNMIFDSGKSGCNMLWKNGSRAVARIWYEA